MPKPTKTKQPIMQWTSINDARPESEGLYLCVVQYQFNYRPYVTILSFRKRGDDKAGFYEINIATHEHQRNLGVTHWQPIPKPPIRSDEENAD